MKIGVFGDSFCHNYDNLGDKNYSWYNMLRSYGHDVTTFGRAGSSLLWSAKQIKQQYDKFDFVIWIITSPQRISIELDEKPYHMHFSSPDSNGWLAVRSLKLDSSKDKMRAVEMWFKYLMDLNDQVLISQSLLCLYKNLYSNLLMLPGFQDSFYPFDTKPDMFNLYDLCVKEAMHYGAEKNNMLARDIRLCHLSIENNAILARLINDNLQPGLFQTDYNNFNMHPSADENFYFGK